MTSQPLEDCLLTREAPGFVLFPRPLAAAAEPEASRALCTRQPQLLNQPESLLIVPQEAPPPPATRRAILTVLPTTDCNLRCSYCYASSGSVKKELPFADFQRIVHDVADPARFSHLTLHLHGGGEPTLNPGLFRKIVEEWANRCRTRFIQPSFTLTSNGTFGRQVGQLIEDHRIRVSISWDGPDDIQHRQRPFASGENSHPVVLKNIRALAALQLLERVRVTVTAGNIDRVPEIIRFLHQEGVASVHLEPVSIMGRQKENMAQGLTVARYARCFQQAYILCCQLGIELKGLGMMVFKRPSGRHCGAFGWNFVVTPWGEISACTRVQQASDDHAASFLLGPWRPGTDPLTFGLSRRERLQQRARGILPECGGCFVKHHCGGGCPMIISGSYDAALQRTDDLPCELIRQCCRQVVAAVRQGYLPPGWQRLPRNF